MKTARSSSRSGKNGRRVGWLAALLGFVGATTDVPGLDAPTALAQAEPYRSAADVPAAWRDFALRLQHQFGQRLASDDKTLRRLADEMAGHGKASESTPPMVTVRVWVSPDGKVDRLEFDGLEGAAAAALRALLSKGEVGAPPADMLQPVRLRLALRPKPQQDLAK